MHEPGSSLLTWTLLSCSATISLILAAAVQISATDMSAVRAEIRRLRWPILAFVGAVVWLGTRHALPGFTVVLHYAALAALGGAAVGYLADKQFATRGQTLWVGAAAVLLLMTLYAWRETYTLDWTGRNGAKYVDTHRRWGRTLVYRRVQELSDEGMAWMEGPMVDDKRQGLWQRVKVRPPGFEDRWFWQDQPVTKDEWNRRGG